LSTAYLCGGFPDSAVGKTRFTKSGAGPTRKHFASPYHGAGRTAASRSPIRLAVHPRRGGTRHLRGPLRHKHRGCGKRRSCQRPRPRERASGARQALSSQCRLLTWAAGQAALTTFPLDRRSLLNVASRIAISADQPPRIALSAGGEPEDHGLPAHPLRVSRCSPFWPACDGPTVPGRWTHQERTAYHQRMALEPSQRRTAP
jgi:hypothetical protein